MTNETFITFQKFNDQGLAIELTEVLKLNSIPFFVDDTLYFNPSFTTSEINREYIVKLKSSDFDKANELLLQLSAQQLQNVEKDYYLFDFTT